MCIGELGIILNWVFSRRERERARKREMKRLNWVGFGSQGLRVDYVGGVGRRRFSWQGSGEIDLVVVVDLGSHSGERLGRN